MPQSYDLIGIGGGPGGLAVAELATAKKKNVFIIEKDGWGGTCTHRGCIPTKALLTCSKYYSDLKKLEIEYTKAGIKVDKNIFFFSRGKFGHSQPTLPSADDNQIITLRHSRTSQFLKSYTR